METGFLQMQLVKMRSYGIRVTLNQGLALGREDTQKTHGRSRVKTGAEGRGAAADKA